MFELVTDWCGDVDVSGPLPREQAIAALERMAEQHSYYPNIKPVVGDCENPFDRAAYNAIGYVDLTRPGCRMSRAFVRPVRRAS